MHKPYITADNILEHHGIKGMHWGIRRESKTNPDLLNRKEVPKDQYKANLREHIRKFEGPPGDSQSMGLSGGTNAAIKAKYRIPKDGTAIFNKDLKANDAIEQAAYRRLDRVEYKTDLLNRSDRFTASRVALAKDPTNKELQKKHVANSKALIKAGDAFFNQLNKEAERGSLHARYMRSSVDDRITNYVEHFGMKSHEQPSRAELLIVAYGAHRGNSDYQRLLR